MLVSVSLTWFMSCSETALHEFSDIVATSGRENKKFLYSVILIIILEVALNMQMVKCLIPNYFFVNAKK